MDVLIRIVRERDGRDAGIEERLVIRVAEIPHRLRIEPLTTAVRSPQSNGMAEAFVKPFKRAYVERMDRSDAITVMRQLGAAFKHYKDIHPHSALKMFSPRMFRRRNAQLSVTACPEK